MSVFGTKIGLIVRQYYIYNNCQLKFEYSLDTSQLIQHIIILDDNSFKIYFSPICYRVVNHWDLPISGKRISSFSVGFRHRAAPTIVRRTSFVAGRQKSAATFDAADVTFVALVAVVDRLARHVGVGFASRFFAYHVSELQSEKKVKNLLEMKRKLKLTKCNCD